MTNKSEILHELLAQRMLEVLRDGRDTVTQDGGVVKVMATAADFNAVRQFLKDNGINSVKSVDSPLNDLVSEMSQRGLKFRGTRETRKAV